MPTRLEKLRIRRNDPLVARKGMAEAYAALQEDDNVKYVIGSMQPIDQAFTDKSFEEGKRVANQISKSYEGNVLVAPEFTFQGSVTSDTHIKAHSDIDLLTIEQKFEYVRAPLQPRTPYGGDALSDLKNLRRQCATVLPNAFPQVNVDTSPGKAIHLSGGSLSRDVDVVVAAWLNTEEYKNAGSDIVLRGVSVLDSAANDIIDNFPFLHNYRINEKDNEAEGNLRKVIRLLKTLKGDADSEPDISSYDIAAIAYAIPSSRLRVGPDGDLQLLGVARTWLSELIEDQAHRNMLMVPNNTRKIFDATGATLVGLKDLHKEVASLAQEIASGLVRKSRILSEARVKIPGTRFSPRVFDRSGLIYRSNLR